VLPFALWLGLVASVPAADFPDFIDRPPVAVGPRYFPRGEGEVDASIFVPRLPRRRPAACAPWRAPVPTNAPEDPSYVGSEYGLGKPGYYGFRPGLGRDDPFGRPLRYCP
jgi:hypothetical protein